MSFYWMAASSIIDLRKLLTERFPQKALPPAGRLVTGLRIFDELLDGGLSKGAITELSSGPCECGHRYTYRGSAGTGLSRTLFRRPD